MIISFIFFSEIKSMNLAIGNIQTNIIHKKDGPSTDESLTSMTISFDMKLKDKVIGACTIFIENSCNPIEFMDGTRNSFAFYPKEDDTFCTNLLNQTRENLTNNPYSKESTRSKPQNEHFQPWDHDYASLCRNLLPKEVIQNPQQEKENIRDETTIELLVVILFL